MRKKIYLLPLLLLALILYSCANESIAFKKGEQAFAIGEYYFAAGYYKQSYSRCSSRKDKDKRAVRAFKMGDCYRRINMVQKAVSAFQNAVRYEVADSTAYLLLAQQLMKTQGWSFDKAMMFLHVPQDRWQDCRAQMGQLQTETFDWTSLVSHSYDEGL